MLLKLFNFCALIVCITFSSAIVLALDLQEYPTQFLGKNGLENAVFVVGENAATSDTFAVTDIVKGFQANLLANMDNVIDESVPPKISEGIKIGREGNEFTYGDSIGTVHSEAFTEEDLPTILADGKFKGRQDKTRTYRQKLTFQKETAEYTLAKIKNRPSGNYFTIRKDKPLYVYTLKFDNPVSYEPRNAEDVFKGKKLTVQGTEYTIRRPKSTTNGLHEFELVLDDTRVWLIQDQPYIYGEHTLTVLNVDRTESKCILDVDGTIKVISEDKTTTLGELSIKLLDAIARHRLRPGTDICELSLGDTTITLKDGEQVLVNEDRIRGSKAAFLGNPGTWEGFTLTYTGGKERIPPNNDDIHLAKGDAWIDPVLSNWKIMFEGTTGDQELMELKANKKSATFTFKNVNIPYYYDENKRSIRLGTKKGPLLLPGETFEGNPKSIQLLYTTPKSKTTRVLEITDIECTSTKSSITLIDKTTGTPLLKGKKLEKACDDSMETLSLKGLGSIQLTITPEKLTYHDGIGYGSGVPQTEHRATLAFEQDSVTLTEKEGGEKQPSTVQFKLTWSSGKESIIVEEVLLNNEPVNWVKSKTEKSKVITTNKGTTITHRNNQHIELVGPKGDLATHVFIGPLTSSIIYKFKETNEKIPNIFEQDYLLLDTEIPAKETRNYIVVGGPCANNLAAQILNNPEPCRKDFTQGEGIIQLVNFKGKTVLLLAGYDAQDTLRTAHILANRKEFLFSGTKMTV